MTKLFTISIPEEKTEMWSKFREVCMREGGISKVILSLVEDYLKKHASGNPSFSLSKWISTPEFVAFPTLGEPAKPELLFSMDARTLTELKKNAESWMMNAEHVLGLLREHQKVHQGLRVSGCPFCGENHG